MVRRKRTPAVLSQTRPGYTRLRHRTGIWVVLVNDHELKRYDLTYWWQVIS